MKKFLIIPRISALDESLELAEEYGFGFEYNDFFTPEVLDDSEKTNELINTYKSRRLPEYCTTHGDFFDVTVASADRKIREISELRIVQSIEIALRLNVKGIVFHSNFNPFFTSSDFIRKWADDNERFWSGILKKYPDIEIYIENMFDKDPRAMRELSERLAEYANYGVCLDHAHAALSGTPHTEWYGALGSYIKHIHINDNDLVSDQHLAVGEGKINWSEFYKLYERFTGSASVLIETSSTLSQRASAEKLKKDGFLL